MTHVHMGAPWVQVGDVLMLTCTSGPRRMMRVVRRVDERTLEFEPVGWRGRVWFWLRYWWHRVRLSLRWRRWT